MVLVFMSSNCFIENIYFKLKGKQLRRKNKNGAITNINDQSFITYYYTPTQLKKIFLNNFSFVKLKPIGVFIPPSYMETKIKKNKWLLNILVKLESG